MVHCRGAMRGRGPYEFAETRRRVRRDHGFADRGQLLVKMITNEQSSRSSARKSGFKAPKEALGFGCSFLFWREIWDTNSSSFPVLLLHRARWCRSCHRRTAIRVRAPIVSHFNTSFCMLTCSPIHRQSLLSPAFPNLRSRLVVVWAGLSR